MGAKMKAPHRWTTGDLLTFHPGEVPSSKPSRGGKYVKLVQEDNKNPDLNTVEVKLNGDPYTVCVYQKQIQPAPQKSPQETERKERAMPEARVSAKELRRQARELNIEGWEELSLHDLRQAVADAQDGGSKPAKKAAPAKRPPSKSVRTAGKPAAAEPEDEDDEDSDDEEDELEEAPAPKRGRAAAKKAPAKKAPAKKAPPAKAKSKSKDDEEAEVANENGNPFKPGSNIFEITEALIKGGKRSTLIKQLKRKIDLKPRTERDDWDEEAELDRRLLIIGQILRRDHSFNVVIDGRGREGTIQAEPPA